MSRAQLLRDSFDEGRIMHGSNAMADLDALAAKNETAIADTVLDALVVAVGSLFGSYSIPVTKDTVRAALVGSNLLTGGQANVGLFAVLYQLNIEPDSEVLR